MVKSVRPRERTLSLEEKYARLEAKTRLLEAENELLKKRDLLERQLMKKKHKRNTPKIRIDPTNDSNLSVKATSVPPI
ncbi:hypothetical protein AB0X74_04575 [Kurthia gibsonii]|uniref:hypothetical protein n=1 Tax=Kurthia gibsonii TaxID=33946 RepID=UPI003F2318C4